MGLCCAKPPSKDEPIQPMIWKSENPEFYAGFASKLLFCYIQPLFDRASYLHRREKALQQEDLVPLPSVDHGAFVEKKFKEGWSKWKPKKIYNEPNKELEARLLHSFWTVVGRRLISAGITKFFNTSLQFTFPLLIQAILKFFEDTQSGKIPSDAPGGERYRGYWLSCILFVALGTKAISENAYFQKVYRCGYQVKVAVSASVYSKSLRMASSEQQKTTLGEMVNLMQVDAAKIEAFVPQFHVLWDGIFQIAGYMVILGSILGWPCIIGLVVLMFAGPVMGVIMARIGQINRSMVKFTDDRVKTTNEALQGIRCVKMYSWEKSFEQEIGKSRQRELDSLRTIAYLRGFSRAYMTALPTVAAVATFLVYAYATDKVVSASTLFSAIVAFDQLRFPLMFYPMALAQLAQAKVSLTRVAKFLGTKEVSEAGYTVNREAEGEIVVKNATLYWNDPNTPIERAETEDDTKSLRSSQHSSKTNSVKSGEDGDKVYYPKPIVSNINLRVGPGDLCAVVGRVGSGKSTLCSAILNETVLGEGSEIYLGGKVAYAAQNPWIINKSIRDNILFGLPYDEDRYHNVLVVCQLMQDLAILDDGDMTEIGERGINLSGGQKQRISVARAAYSHADVLILDDPLSALDPEVAGKLFEECIIGFMKGKTRFLVTNQLQCLPQCDFIVALGEGIVIEQGTYSELMSDENGEVQRLLKDIKETALKGHTHKENTVVTDVKKTSTVHKEASSESDALANTEHEAVEQTSKTKNLTTQEEREIGAVKLQVYLKYLKAGGGYFRFAIVYFGFMLCAATTLMGNVVVTLWTSDANYVQRSQGFYLGMYATSAVVIAFFTYVRSYLLASFGVRAANTLHKRLLASVLKAPMSFFDTTPTGRVLSRFSKDMYSIDVELSDQYDFVLFMTLSVLVTFGTIIFATPWFSLPLIPLMYVYIRVLNYFREVSRETKRVESLSRSPVYAHFSETLGGLSTIRAYGEAENFVIQFEAMIDSNTQAFYCNKVSDRWLSVRLELIGSLVAGLAAVFATSVAISDGASGISNKDKFASLAGLSLTSAIQVTGMLNWVVRTFAQLEAAMNSCERVFYYSEHIPQEAASTCGDLARTVKTNQPDKSVPSTLAVIACGGEVVRPASDWPSNGDITLNNLLMRYRPGTPLVLKGLDVVISGGERIGVVGRTGSGKSSLLLCLMRIVEPELYNTEADEYKAPITIDGVDVLRVGLYDLRSKLGIIPQNPVLFSGTIRSNMDPFHEYSDDQIWSALDQCSMKHAVLDMPDELDAPVAEYGENLSQGQRQMLCLGRALLKQCRILLLDEATSSIDFETDREIQRTIRKAFAGSTVVTIAHRVNTIMDSDKILVMKDGKAAEFGPPEELLKDEKSLFSEIVNHSNAEKD